ncbi:MAG TPA: hypothetical protein PK544_01235 [Spirochaetota bacterium]|mgnify:CR=1 FL=1|nr:hypothetical protein [Spirochaetota bacterium]HPJ37761.1 hypothetical protein [Spirochaetota bacterium]HPQ52379.1 hypothetical protein [Spirochaetota bacterium]
MIIPLNKLLSFNGNKYIFTRAAMEAVDKLDYIMGDIEGEDNWKTVPNILELFLNEKLKYKLGSGKKEIVEEKEVENVVADES